MMVSADHQRVINMLKESISLMCKSSLCFDIELSVEGLLGVTLDKKDIFLVSINELIQKNMPVEKRANQRSENSGCSMFKGEEDRERETCSPPLRKKRQRRRRSSQNSTGSDFQLEDARTTTADKQDSDSLDIPGIKAEESESQQNQEEIVIKQEVDQDAFIDSDSFSGVADLESEMPYPMSLTRASGGVDLGDDMSMATSQNLQIPLMDPLPSTSTHRYYPPKRFSEAPRTQQTNQPDKIHRCRFCGLRLPGPALLKSHLETAHGSLVHVCQYCHRVFTSKAARVFHEKTHTAKAERCQICFKVFPAKSHLDRHMFTHSNHPFTCNKCPARFPGLDQLKKHAATVHNFVVLEQA